MYILMVKVICIEYIVILIKKLGVYTDVPSNPSFILLFTPFQT